MSSNWIFIERTNNALNQLCLLQNLPKKRKELSVSVFVREGKESEEESHFHQKLIIVTREQFVNDIVDAPVQDVVPFVLKHQVLFHFQSPSDERDKERIERG